MAFQNKNLSVIAYANGFTLWHYSAAETLATITANGPFRTIDSSNISMVSGYGSMATRI